MARINDSTQTNMIGKKVRKLRKLKGWSQKDLSIKLELEAVYIYGSSVSRIESQTRAVTDFEVYGLARVFGVSVQELFD